LKFVEAFQADLAIEVGNEVVAVPRFTLGDFVSWAAEVDARKRAEFDALADARPDADERARFRLTFRPVPADVSEVAGLVYTPAGVERVLAACFARAKITRRDGRPVEPPEPFPADRAERVMAGNLPLLPRLARLLAGVEVEIPAKADAEAAAEQAKEDEAAGPLPPPPAGSPPG
jgi:hypothetical protein